MRGHVAGLRSPHPLGPALPALYQDDDFALRMLSALDEVIAPVYATLDSFDAYLDPHLAPEDFLSWLATWVGIGLDESWDEARRREAVARAAELYRLRGTATGLAAQVEIQTGGTVEIVENGATGWSVDPGGEMPGSPAPMVVVRVTVPDPRAVDATRLDALVAAAKPAHVPHRIELVKGSGPKDRGEKPEAAVKAAPAPKPAPTKPGRPAAGETGATPEGSAEATAGDEPAAET
jgi:phage tail-like protein